MSKPMTYKGYCAKIEYSDEHGCLIGRVSDIRHSIIFQGESVEQIKQAFEEAVDLYLAGCAGKKEEPEKPSTTPSVVRMSSALYGLIAFAARQEKKSVNEWLTETDIKQNDKEDKE